MRKKTANITREKSVFPQCPSVAKRRASAADPRAELRELQRLMTSALFRPLTVGDHMQPRWIDGRKTSEVAAGFIKPNDRLTSFERLEIYNRCYWFRLLDCLFDDYPGLRAILGERKFMKLARAYLEKYPSASFTLRNLGGRLEQFLREEPEWIAPRAELALDMARFEWAQVVAFDGEARPPITPDDILDATPGKLRLSLQPYVSLLALDFAVDEFLLAIKKRDSDVLRGEASNVIEAMPHAPEPAKKIRMPKRERIHLAVHRHENALYYKRLEPEAFAILGAIASGATVEKACADTLSGSRREDVGWSAKIKEWFENWTSLGWFCQRVRTR